MELSRTRFDLPQAANSMIASRSQLLILTFLLTPQFASAQPQPQSPQYTVTDLGSFTARSLNDSSRVAGSMGNKAVLHSDGVLRDITPPGGVIAEAFGINNLGQVVGRVFICDFVNGNCVNGRTRAFVFDRGAHALLGTLGGRDSRAHGINDSGQVTGYSDAAAPSPQVPEEAHAFIFQNGVFEDIGARSNTISTIATSINASGQVAGHAGSNTSDRGAFVFSNGSFTFFETSGAAHDINAGGQVVGHFGGNDDGSGRAFLFTGGVRQDLGTLSPLHTFSKAQAINSAGTVVGVSSPSFFSSEGERAFIFKDGTMQDLNSLVAADPARVLASAADINDAGQIVVNGLINGQNHAFLLTPTEPMLLAEPNTNKAIAVQSVLFFRDPFAITTAHNLGGDARTRLTILARNIETSAGEIVAPPTVTAQTAQHPGIALPVEFVGKVPGSSWLTQIVVSLPNELNGAGEVQLSVSFRGRTSNRTVINIVTAPVLP